MIICSLVDTCSAISACKSTAEAVCKGELTDSKVVVTPGSVLFFTSAVSFLKSKRPQADNRSLQK